MPFIQILVKFLKVPVKYIPVNVKFNFSHFGKFISHKIKNIILAGFVATKY